jgi:hypothetical protein
MVKLAGGSALMGLLIGIGMVAFGLAEHLSLFPVFGGFVGLVSLLRLFGGDDDAESGRT